jgi:hypothetical protein
MTATLEDVQEIVIDKWGSLNTAASPGRLPDGHSPRNLNVWTDEKDGSLVTSNGYIFLGTTPSNTPTTFIINYFKTSDGSQTVVLSDGVTVWKTINYVDFTVITTGLSPFFQLRGYVIRGKLWLTNGNDSVMTYDGTTLTLLDGSGSTPDVPIAKYISYHDERVWLYGVANDPSSLIFSALTDSAGVEITPDDADAWPSDNEIQISEGDDDIGTGLFLFRGYLYASKSFSIWRVVGYDEYTYTRVKTRSSTGTRFQESVQILDNLVHFIGVDGLYTFDGEDSKRVSDIIDPSSSDPGVFAFRNLQQPLLNNQFINVSETADWNLGTFPHNLSTASDQLSLIPADTSEADFTAGVLKTFIETDLNPGSIQLTRLSTGSSSVNIAAGRPASLVADPGFSVIGSALSITDGNLSVPCGFLRNSGSGSPSWRFTVPAGLYFTKIIIRDWRSSTSRSLTISTSIASGILTVNNGGSLGGGNTFVLPASAGGVDFTVTFGSAFISSEDSFSDFRLSVALPGTPGTQSATLAEIELYATAYRPAGQFTSRTIDYVYAPTSLGSLAATVTANGESYQFYTQSSADGSTWDSEVNVTGSGTIGSIPRRYLRWGVYLYSASGSNSPVIDDVYLPGVYTSQVFNTGGNIFQWGAFQLIANRAGQTVTAHFRAASTGAGVLTESWTAIAPGAVPSAATTDTFIQIQLQLSTNLSTQVPYVSSFAVNWTLANGSGVNTLQNVASIVILNRYWLAAATLGSEANDIVIVRGKATRQSPWHQKDFAFLSFAFFQDYFIAGSSLDGSIYRLEYGFSKSGSAMDSYFETADLSKSGFMLQIYEVLVSLDRMGPYTISVGLSTDGGLSFTEKTIDLTRSSAEQSLNFIKKLNVNVMCDSFRLRFRTNMADQPFSVDDARVFYRLLPSRGSLG